MLNKLKGLGWVRLHGHSFRSKCGVYSGNFYFNAALIDCISPVYAVNILTVVSLSLKIVQHIEYVVCS